MLIFQHLHCLLSNFPLFSHLENDLDRVMTDDIMTIKELAEYLKLNEKTAYRLVSEGEIPGFKVGGSWRFRKSDIETWISEQKNSRQQ